MGQNGMDKIEKVLDIVNEAVSTNNYTSMAKNIGDLFTPESSEDLYQSVKDRFTGNKYRAGHMEGPAYRNASAQNGAAGTYGQNPQAPNGAARTTAWQNPRMQNGTVRTPVRQNVQAQRNPYYGTASSVAGKVLFGIGIAGVILFLIPAGLGLWGVIGGGIARVLGTIPLVLAGGFGVMAVCGNSMTHTVSRFAKYQAVLGSRMYADVSELAAAAGRSGKAVVKDLRKMTAEGWFRQGHFDAQCKTFMATDELYSQYQQTEKNAEAIRKDKENADARNAGLSEDVRQILDKGNAYIAHIRQANDAIADEAVSDKLTRMENIVSKIFAQVRKQPSLAKNLNMFMDYYLPTTTKLIDAYQEMSSQPVRGENIRSAQNEIEGSLDTINNAFENLLDSFFKDKALDVSTDISVMKTMMKQQGLTPDDLEEMKRRQGQMEKGPTLEELKTQIRETEKARDEATTKV